MSLNREKRVAVIGSGLAGLSCAWWLRECDVQVDIFEKEAEIGLGAHSVKIGNSETYVDVPARVFVHGFYQQMLSMYKYIGINMSPASAAPSFQKFGFPPTFNINNYLTSTGRAIPYIRPQIIWDNILTVFRVVKDLIRYKIYCTKVLSNPSLYNSLGNVSLHNFTKEHGYSVEFVEKFLIPCFAVIATCSREAVQRYPMNIVIHYTASVFLTGRTFRRLKHGTRHTALIMSEKLTGVFSNCKIHNVKPVNNGKVLVKFEMPNDGVRECEYDHVVFAVQANQVTPIHPHIEEEVKEALESIKYEYSECIVHTDEKLMPLSREDWSPLNIFVLPNKSNKIDENRNKECSIGDAIMCTIWQNRIQEMPRKVLKSEEEMERDECFSDDVFQTWNPLVEPHPSKVLPNGRVSFLRSIVGVDTERAYPIIESHQGKRSIWYCGAYSIRGVPLLENACDSGLRVAESITGNTRPWRKWDDIKGSRFSYLSFIGTDQKLHVRSTIFLALILCLAYWLFVSLIFP